MAPAPEGREFVLGTEAPVRAVVVGAGAMGRHHVRLLSRLLGPDAVLVVDTDRARAEGAALEHGASVAAGIDEILNAVDVAVVAVPTVDHLEVSARLIEAGIHVLVEKPIAADLSIAC
ncbi:MAG: hypothetical protein F4230_10510 [Holophagales bacterium]|nr:hypothetical protein [Holophagales bacterium]